MPQNVESPITNDNREEKRAVIILALDEIAIDIDVALRDANLNFPVYLTVPHSGEALATLACPVDPSDEEWSEAATIACLVVSERLGDVRLCGRPLPCAVANSMMGAADIINTAVSNTPS